LERKVLDALERIEGKIDDFEYKLDDVNLGLKAVVAAFDQNREAIEKGLDKTNELVGAGECARHNHQQANQNSDREIGARGA
jgi:hypothetical protein